MHCNVHTKTKHFAEIEKLLEKKNASEKLQLR